MGFKKGQEGGAETGTKGQCGLYEGASSVREGLGGRLKKAQENARHPARQRRNFKQSKKGTWERVLSEWASISKENERNEDESEAGNSSSGPERQALGEKRR